MIHAINKKSVEYAILVIVAGMAFLATYWMTRAAQRGEVPSGSAAVAAPEPPAPAPSSSPPAAAVAKGPGAAPPGMVWIKGGEFFMGTDDSQANPAERPAHRVRVGDF